MMFGLSHARGVIGGAGLALAAVAAPAAAQAESPLVQVAAAPVGEAVARYATPEGGYRFTLDRRGANALLRFDNDDEVLALSPAPGPRGDELYKLDTGRVVLRVTSLGGVTIFPPQYPKGLPAELVGPADPLAPPGPRQRLAADLAALSQRAQATLGRTVRFETPVAEGAATGLVGDAAARAAAGLSPSGGVNRVVILIGPRPSAEMRPDGALQVFVAPQMGYAGRPSSAMVSRVSGVQPPPR